MKGKTLGCEKVYGRLTGQRDREGNLVASVITSHGKADVVLPARCHVLTRTTGQNSDQRVRLTRRVMQMGACRPGTAVTALVNVECEEFGAPIYDWRTGNRTRQVRATGGTAERWGEGSRAIAV